jgi:tetratricopeptide (TPR) repeat protein
MLVDEAPVTRRNPLVIALALGMLAAAAPARAQTPPIDPVPEGYRLLYGGDKAASAKYFDDLLKSRPDDLPVRYGWLMAQRNRLGDATLRTAYEKALDACLTLADKRYDKNSKDAEALFYLAQAHLMRAEYRFDNNKGMWGAARDGANAKGYAETYIKQHPENGDAYFVLGMYNYYVDIAPTLVHFLRFLMFLPGGDRVNGLKQIERAGAQGTLFGPVAKSMLVEIYSGYEGRGTEAAAVAEQLQRQFPTNDEVAFKLAGIYSGPLFEDRARAASVFQGIADRRKNDKTPDGASAHFNAILGLATMKQEAFRLDEAIALLGPTIDAKVAFPEWVLAQFLIRRSNYKMLQNDPAAGEDARRVVGDPNMAPWHTGAQNLLTTIDQRKASGEAATYAALLPGNRLTIEGKWDEALKAYEPVRARDPQNPLIRYRLAYFDFARGRTDLALPVFTALAASGKTTSDAIRANSFLYVGRIQDLAGRRTDACKAYQRVVDDFTNNPRVVSAAKVGLLTPYHRPATAVVSRD